MPIEGEDGANGLLWLLGSSSLSILPLGVHTSHSHLWGLLWLEEYIPVSRLCMQAIVIV